MVTTPSYPKHDQTCWNLTGACQHGARRAGGGVAMDAKNHAYALWIALRGLMDDEQGARTAIEEALVCYSNACRADKLQESARRLRALGDGMVAVRKVAGLLEEHAAALLREPPESAPESKGER